MLLRQLLTVAAASTALAGCASAPPVTSTAQAGGDQNVTDYPMVKRWTGKLNPTQSYQATAVASRRQNAYGNVELTVSPASPTLSRVTMTVSVPQNAGFDILGWGVSQGRCGSGNPQVLAPTAFTPIQISTSGRGSVDVKIPFVIPEGGAYSVSVYRGSGTQLSDVITCAELRQEH
jgi:hypothetical protein